MVELEPGFGEQRLEGLEARKPGAAHSVGAHIELDHLAPQLAPDYFKWHACLM